MNGKAFTRPGSVVAEALRLELERLRESGEPESVCASIPNSVSNPYNKCRYQGASLATLRKRHESAQGSGDCDRVSGGPSRATEGAGLVTRETRHPNAARVDYDDDAIPERTEALQTALQPSSTELAPSVKRGRDEDDAGMEEGVGQETATCAASKSAEPKTAAPRKKKTNEIGGIDERGGKRAAAAETHTAPPLQLRVPHCLHRRSDSVRLRERFEGSGPGPSTGMDCGAARGKGWPVHGHRCPSAPGSL